MFMRTAGCLEHKYNSRHLTHKSTSQSGKSNLDCTILKILFTLLFLFCGLELFSYQLLTYWATNRLLKSFFKYNQLLQNQYQKRICGSVPVTAATHISTMRTSRTIWTSLDMPMLASSVWLLLTSVAAARGDGAEPPRSPISQQSRCCPHMLKLTPRRVSELCSICPPLWQHRLSMQTSKPGFNPFTAQGRCNLHHQQSLQFNWIKK